MSWLRRLMQPSTKPTEAPNRSGVEQQIPMMPTVKFDESRITKTVAKALNQYIGEMPDIEKKKVKQVFELALQTVAGQGKLDVFRVALMRLDIPGMTKSRAIQIGVFIDRRAGALIERERQESLGIKYATWRYSSAPCFDGPTNPVQIKLDAGHSAANGKRYEISKGLLVNGKRTWPGMDEGCKCISLSEFPGLPKQHW